MALTDIIDATAGKVAADPARAAVRFRVEGTGTEGVLTSLTVRSHLLTVDEPPSLGGRDAAANPVEFALAALASCQVVTYRFWAAKLGIELGDITVDADGDLDIRGFFGLDESVRPGFGAVRLTVTVNGPEPVERYRELQVAVDAHCPVLDVFGSPTPVDTRLQVGIPTG